MGDERLYHRPDAAARSESDASVARPAPRPLTKDEAAEVARKKALVEQHLPGMADLIREFYKLGAVEGWRCVTSVEVSDEPTE